MWPANPSGVANGPSKRNVGGVEVVGLEVGHGGWKAFAGGDVNHLEWQSATSKSQLIVRKKEPGVWSLEYVPGKDPGYEGEYFALYRKGEAPPPEPSSGSTGTKRVCRMRTERFE